MIYIGIDTGVNTGVAVWDTERQSFELIKTMSITQAMDIVREYKAEGDVKVRFEDARLRKWVTGGREKLQGVGSVKRDCAIWEEFCKGLKIPYEAVPPKNNTTKLSAEQFKRITGINYRTSEHARDAAMLVFRKVDK